MNTISGVPGGTVKAHQIWCVSNTLFLRVHACASAACVHSCMCVCCMCAFMYVCVCVCMNLGLFCGSLIVHACTHTLSNQTLSVPHTVDISKVSEGQEMVSLNALHMSM